MQPAEIDPARYCSYPLDDDNDDHLMELELNDMDMLPGFDVEYSGFDLGDITNFEWIDGEHVRHGGNNL
eukprot:jgi/Psemu1/300786/fgenesh1_kg.19_\